MIQDAVADQAGGDTEVGGFGGFGLRDAQSAWSVPSRSGALRLLWILFEDVAQARRPGRRAMRACSVRRTLEQASRGLARAAFDLRHVEREERAITRTTTAPSTVTWRTSEDCVEYAICDHGLVAGTVCSVETSTAIRSARLPISSVPISRSRPRAAAPPRVARRTASGGGEGARARSARFVKKRGQAGSMKPSRLLLQGAPSAPSATETPAAISSGSGQMPEASLRFDDGQLRTCAPRAARQRTFGPFRRVDAVGDARVRPEQAGLVEDDDVVLAEPLADRRDISPGVLASRGCGCAHRGPSPWTPDLAQQARRCTRARTAARTRSAGGHAARPCQALIPGARIRRARHAWCRAEPLQDLRRSAASIIALPIVARIPERCTAPKIASVWCTVAMSADRRRAAEQGSAHASSPAAERVAASSSEALVRPDHLAKPVERARGRRLGRGARASWQVWTWAWTSPGSTTAIGGVEDRVVARLRRVVAADLGDRSVAGRDDHL